MYKLLPKYKSTQKSATILLKISFTGFITHQEEGSISKEQLLTHQE
jgi:hypothetical protein